MNARVLSLLLAVCWVVPIAADASAAEQERGVRIVSLSGTPYELGHQHGVALRQ